MEEKMTKQILASEIKSSDIMKWAKNELKRQKVMVPDYPEDQTSLTEAELSVYMGEFSAMYSWCTRLLGLTEAELTVLESEVELKISKYTGKARQQENGKLTKDQQRAWILGNEEELTESYEKLQNLIALQTMLEAACRACDKSAQALSRDLTRREIEIKKRG